MPDAKEKARAAVERLFKRNPGAATADFQAAAAKHDASVKKLNARSFHASYVLRLKRAASAGTRAAKKAAKKAAPGARARRRRGQPRRRGVQKATGLTVRLSVALPSGTQLVYSDVASLKKDADLLAAAAKQAGS